MTSSEAKENLRMESADFKEMQRGKNSTREAFISTGLLQGCLALPAGDLVIIPRICGMFYDDMASLWQSYYLVLGEALTRNFPDVADQELRLR